METENQSRLDRLEKRIALLEQKNLLDGKINGEIIRFSKKAFDYNLSENVETGAKIMALLCLLDEIVAHMGVDNDVLQDRYVHYCNHWHERLLHATENIDPGTAAKIDNRRAENIGTTDVPPPLFSF
jgi:hypothetical protein